MVKGWLASDGEARFAWTGLREAARSVGVEKAAGAVAMRCSTTQPKRGRGADECCTAAIECREADRGWLWMQKAEAEWRGQQKRLLEWLRKENRTRPKTADVLSWEQLSSPARALV
jgi:hypothetical protein